MLFRSYSAFFGSLLIWSWFELAFLSGFITGPSKELCPQGIDQIKRFSYALSTIAYSELLLFITLLSMVYLSTGANNTVGLWTFGILFFARICAKLNLFLGVPSINTEFLPSPVVHLASYFRVGSTSWFFPVSISLISFTLFVLVDNIFETLRVKLEEDWETTIVVTLTEFGRTVAVNGSLGTDHGYGSAGLLAGGDGFKEKVVTDWPGLKKTDLHDGRDLMATLDYRSVLSACLEKSFGLSHDLITKKVFQDPKIPRFTDDIFPRA